MQTHGIATAAIVGVVLINGGCRTRNRDNIEPMKQISAIVLHSKDSAQVDSIKKVTMPIPTIQRMEDSRLPTMRRGGALWKRGVDESVSIGFLCRCGVVDSEAYSMIKKEEKHCIDDIGGFVSMIEEEGLKEEEVYPIFQMAKVDGVPIEVTVSLFYLAYEQGVSATYLSAAFNMGLSRGISMPEMVDFFSIAKENPIMLKDVIKLFSIALDEKIPPPIVSAVLKQVISKKMAVDLVVGLSSISVTSGIPPESVVEVYATLRKEKISHEIAMAILPMSTAKTVRMLDAEIAILSKEGDYSVGGLRIEAMTAILAILGQTSENFPLKSISELFASRWDVLTPPEYSALWELKQRAVEMEAQGGNTDALWHEFWDRLLKAPNDYD